MTPGRLRRAERCSLLDRIPAPERSRDTDPGSPQSSALVVIVGHVVRHPRLIRLRDGRPLVRFRVRVERRTFRVRMRGSRALAALVLDLRESVLVEGRFRGRVFYATRLLHGRSTPLRWRCRIAPPASEAGAVSPSPSRGVSYGFDEIGDGERVGSGQEESGERRNAP